MSSAFNTALPIVTDELCLKFRLKINYLCTLIKFPDVTTE